MASYFGNTAGGSSGSWPGMPGSARPRAGTQQAISKGETPGAPGSASRRQGAGTQSFFGGGQSSFTRPTVPGTPGQPGQSTSRVASQQPSTPRPASQGAGAPNRQFFGGQQAPLQMPTRNQSAAVPAVVPDGPQFQFDPSQAPNMSLNPPEPPAPYQPPNFGPGYGIDPNFVPEGMLLNQPQPEPPSAPPSFGPDYQMDPNFVPEGMILQPEAQQARDSQMQMAQRGAAQPASSGRTASVTPAASRRGLLDSLYR